jgi:hypothetical protein
LILLATRLIYPPERGERSSHRRAVPNCGSDQPKPSAASPVASGGLRLPVPYSFPRTRSLTSYTSTTAWVGSGLSSLGQRPRHWARWSAPSAGDLTSAARLGRAAPCWCISPSQMMLAPGAVRMAHVFGVAAGLGARSSRSRAPVPLGIGPQPLAAADRSGSDLSLISAPTGHLE